MKYIVEIFYNKTDSLVLHDVLFIAVVADILKVTRWFDEPIFDLKDILKFEVKLQQS